MQQLSALTTLVIECTKVDCRSELAYPLESKLPLPDRCSVCSTKWGDQIQDFKNAVRAEMGNGGSYTLHLDFGRESSLSTDLSSRLPRRGSYKKRISK